MKILTFLMMLAFGFAAMAQNPEVNQLNDLARRFGEHGFPLMFILWVTYSPANTQRIVLHLLPPELVGLEPENWTVGG